jgi:hypothetical protein
VVGLFSLETVGSALIHPEHAVAGDVPLI